MEMVCKTPKRKNIDAIRMVDGSKVDASRMHVFAMQAAFRSTPYGIHRQRRRCQTLNLIVGCHVVESLDCRIVGLTRWRIINLAST